MGQTHLHERLRHHRDGAHAHRHPEEQREDRPVAVGAQQGGRHQHAGGDPETQRQEQPTEADPGDGETAPADDPRINLEPAERDQEENAELSHRVEQVKLRGVTRKQPVREGRPQRSEQ